MLSNGLPVWVVETHEVPVVQVNLVLLVGSGDDAAAKYGLASLTAAMLDEGAGNRSALEIADAIEFVGATLATTSSFDASAVRLNVPVERMQEALPVMADVALRPTFPEEELDRLRQERITALIQARDEPESIAPLAFSRLLYRADASVRHRRHRHAGHAQGDDHRGPEGVPLVVLPAVERHARRGRRRDRRRRDDATREAVRRVEGRRTREACRGAGCAAAATRRDRDRGQARCRAVADPDRVGGRRARHAGLLRPAGAEHDPRRLVHVAAEPEPPREERLRLRRGLALRHAPGSGSVLRRRRRADRQDVGRAARVLQRAERHHEARARGRAEQGEELHRARLPERVRDDWRPLGTHRGAARLQAVRELLRAVRAADSRGDVRRRAEGGGQVHPAVALHGGRGRRQEDNRARRPRA